MKHKKTLVILSPGFPVDETDSTCLPMQQHLVKALKKNDPELEIVILSFQYPYHNKPYSWFEMLVIPFNGRNKGGITRLLLRRKIVNALKEIHDKTPVTSILSFWYGECAAVGKFFSDKYDMPHFCWIPGQDVKSNNKYPKRLKLRPNELIAISDTSRAEFEKNHGTSPQHIIPPGIDPSLFPATGKQKTIDILGAGSLIPLKQYRIFVELVSEIKKHLPGINAVLVGQGPEKEKLTALIAELGLQANVKLVGELPYPEVLDKMQQAKIFLHPSETEGFSGVCLEAIYAGAHAISFCRAMYEDIEQWHIVSSGDEMKHTALRVLLDPEAVYKRVMYSSINETSNKMAALLFQRK